MARILIVEDDAQIRKFLRISLAATGFEVSETRRGADALTFCAESLPDLIVLDLGLPDLDGREVVERLREWSAVPIIVLSVRSDDADKVGALDAGANDYVTKPFSISELMARIRVLLRARPTADREAGGSFEYEDLQIDLARRRIHMAGEELRLSRKEYDLLRLLVAHSDRVLTHQQILSEVWGAAHESDIHYLRVLVGHLRQKLGDNPSSPRYVHTVQGVGYRFGER
jgi:two-component system KDP operon response regulator KdpE